MEHVTKHLKQRKTAIQKDDESHVKIWICLRDLGNKKQEPLKHAYMTLYMTLTKNAPCFVLQKMRNNWTI